MNIAQVIQQFGTRTENGSVIVSPKAIYARASSPEENAAAREAFNEFVASLRKRTYTKRITSRGNEEFTFDAKADETLQVRLVLTESQVPSKFSNGYIKDKTLVFDPKPIAVPNINFKDITSIDDIRSQVPIEEDHDMLRKSMADEVAF